MFAVQLLLLKILKLCRCAEAVSEDFTKDRVPKYWTESTVRPFLKTLQCLSTSKDKTIKKNGKVHSSYSEDEQQTRISAPFSYCLLRFVPVLEIIKAFFPHLIVARFLAFYQNLQRRDLNGVLKCNSSS